MQTSRGKLGASFAAVILGGILLALVGLALNSPNNPPITPAPLAPATTAPAARAPASPVKQTPLKPALPLGISPQLYA
ncbi:MAG: hypothetical protein ACREDH_12345, partial [Methylocella sp.]